MDKEQFQQDMELALRRYVNALPYPELAAVLLNHITERLEELRDCGYDVNYRPITVTELMFTLN